MAVDICHADHMALTNMAVTSPTSGSCSVDIVCLRTKAMEFYTVLLTCGLTVFWTPTIC
jgi:hypothetical protein